MNLTNPFYKKTVTYKYGDKTLSFRVSQNLFSSQNVDHDTQRLLRTLLYEKVDSYKKALDLGCGYGPIGVALKATCPAAEVHMTDRDALAIEYSKENAELNKVGQVKTYGSLGYDNIPDKNFDLIVSNIPAKVGEPILRHMIKDAQDHLVENGRVVIVVIDAIVDFIDRELTADENIKILFKRSWSGHHVYHYSFNSKGSERSSLDQTAFNAGEFYRQKNEFNYENQNYQLVASHNLPEFDQLSYDTQLLLSNLRKIKGGLDEILCFNPGQGYIPLALIQEFSPQHISLVDRDLLALKTAHHNLIKNGFPENNIDIKHQVGLEIPKKVKAVIGVVPEKQNLKVYQMVIDQISSELKQNAYVLLSSSSAVITRLQDLLSKTKTFQTLLRDKKRGRSVLLIRKIS